MGGSVRHLAGSWELALLLGMGSGLKGPGLAQDFGPVGFWCPLVATGNSKHREWGELFPELCAVGGGCSSQLTAGSHQATCVDWKIPVVGWYILSYSSWLGWAVPDAAHRQLCLSTDLRVPEAFVPFAQILYIFTTWSSCYL